MKQMQSQVVIGLGFGDEGKGLVTNYLCSQTSNPLVIRFSGGHQAGHTVVYNGKRHVFSNFGAGTLQGVPTYWSEHCTVDPIGLMNELNVLKTISNEKIVLNINENCPITTPYDVYSNQRLEKELYKHGSVGVGFGTTIERNEKRVTLVFSDLFDPIILKIKLDHIRKYYLGIEDIDMSSFNLAVEEMVLFNKTHIRKVSFLLQGYDYIFEGSQGLLLDQDIGFFPNVTRSNVGSKRINKFPESIDGDTYYITRAYQTRHGNGPMTNENYDLKLVNNEKETNVENDYQGHFRVAPLDLNLLRYALDSDLKNSLSSKDYLVITCMDQMTEYLYSIDGHIKIVKSANDFIKDISNYLGFEGGEIALSYSDESDLKKW